MTRQVPVRPVALFDEDFDHRPRPVPVPEVILPEVAHTPEDLAAARELGWAAGHAAGIAAAEQARDAETLAILARIAEDIAATRAAIAAGQQEMAGELARTLCAAMHAALPALCAAHGAREVRAVAAEILPHLAHEAHVRIQVAACHIAGLEGLLATLADEVGPQARLVVDETLGPSGIRIRWHHGEAVRDPRAIWQSIAEILAAHDLLGVPDTQVSPHQELIDVA